MPKIAVASSSYEHRVCEQALPKKFAAQSFALERVADGRLVIPCWVRMARVELLYLYVAGIKVHVC